MPTPCITIQLSDSMLERTELIINFTGNVEGMSKGEIIIYQTADGNTSLDVKLEQGTIWLNQKQIAELFGTKRPAITKHLKNIFLSGELEENSVCFFLEPTTPHGARADKTQTTAVKYYNLDAILSVGYRVNSKNATPFRIWANKVLKEIPD